MKGDDFIKAQIARLAYRDAGDDGLNGMRAVAFVIRNRNKAGWYSGQWIPLLNDHYKFSATLQPPPDVLPNTNSPAVMAFLQEIDGIFYGITPDTVTTTDKVRGMLSDLGQPNPPALYYGNLARANNLWFLDQISRNTEKHRLIATVGSLSFFT